ncbi:MAG: hypothetical protein WD942_08185 [Dehalococcoidia bacterium]
MTGPTVISDQNQRRMRVTEGLRARSVRLAGMYIAALRELDSTADADGETARVSVICHCMRELMSGLPAVMAASAMQRPKPSSSSLVAKLPDILTEHPQLDLRAQQANVPVPTQVASVIADLVEAAVKERGLNIANAAALLTEGTDTSHPLLAQWKSAQGFFVEWAHLDRNADGARELPTDADIAAHVRVVEDVVEVRSNLFFTNLSAVEDLLALANAQEDGPTL